MKAFVIRISGNQYSIKCAERCVNSAASFGLSVEIFDAITPDTVDSYMSKLPFNWTWAGNNDTKLVHKETGLKHFPYDGSINTKTACFLSHYFLWKKSIELNEPIVILEHDAVFISEFPHNIEFNGICQINDPDGSFSKGRGWSAKIIRRGTIGAHPKTRVQAEGIPDGLAGNSAYVIKPWAAQDLVDITHKYGLWPNDALMCIQLFPYLEEYYPFITKVVQYKSTSQGI